MQPALSIYFFHTRNGQSIALRFEPNDWIVFDAYKAGIVGRNTWNPALDLLRSHESEEDFRLRAVVLSHFHLDHYLGLPEIIRHFREQDRLESVVMPASLDLFRVLLERSSQEGFLRPLDELLLLLDELEAEGRPPMVIDAYNYLFPATPEEIELHDRWIFCFHPLQKDVIKAVGNEGRVENRKPIAPHLDLDWIRSQANHFSYVLGVGLGREDRDLHVLLTADVTGKAFDERTRELRDRLVPQSRGDHVGPAPRLRNLVVEDSGAPGGLRIRPLDGITIPHHGSAGDLLGEDELQWWLGGSTVRRGGRPIAVVQGRDSAFRPETLERFGAAGFRIFASSRPTRLVSTRKYGPELDKRLLGAPGDLLTYGPESTETTDHEPGYLALHGSPNGIDRIEGERFYEVVWPEGEVRFHPTINEPL